MDNFEIFVLQYFFLRSKGWQLVDFKKVKNRHKHCKLRLISSTGPTFDQLEQAVQYNNKQYKANRDGTPNK